MKCRLLFAIAMMSMVFTVNAQDATVKDLKSASERTVKKDANDTASWRWKKGGLYGINVAQGSLSNWIAGGDNFSFNINSILSLFAFYKNGKNTWDNTLDFNLGYVNTTSLGSRKNDDRLDLLSVYSHKISSKWGYGLLGNFRTQLFDGFTYPDNKKTFTSAFLSPAYLLVSPGFNYKPNDNFSFFISPATAKWTIVNNSALSAKGAYGVTPGKKSLSQFGAFASASYIKALSKQVAYKGRLDLFSNYKKDPQNVDIYMTNILNVKLHKALSLTYSLDMIYDHDAIAKMQLKSLVGAGLLFNF